MSYEIVAHENSFVISVHGREVMRVATLEEAQRLMADVLDEGRAKVIKLARPSEKVAILDYARREQVR